MYWPPHTESMAVKSDSPTDTNATNTGTILLPRSFWPTFDADRITAEARAIRVASQSASAPHVALSSDDVRIMQEILNARGYTDIHGHALTVDGHYGKRTREAVEAFQRDQNLAVDGIAGPDTWAALREAARTPDVGTTPLDTISEQLTTPPAYLDDTHQQLAFLQAQLREMQRQMEAMERQRTAERERDETRTASNEPVQHAPRHASTSLTTERLAYSDPRHPVHPLYADVKQRLEAQGHALPEDRLTQITGELHMRHFQPNWEGYVKVQNDKVLAGDYHPWGGMLTLDLKEPAPAAQETLQQVDTHQQALMQEQALRAQQTQSLGQGHALSR
jgi:peptidoglycan hydrolase-like protein with peptidoglycan-binding domain